MRKQEDIEVAELGAEDVYAAMVEALLARDLKPGMKLSEETIASSFHVNRMVVRGVLNRLHAEALVEIHKNRGAYVSSPTVEEAREIFDLRIVLEREVASRLATQITPPQLNELQKQVADHRESYRAGREAEARRFAERFHQRAAEMVGNRVLQSTLDKLITRSALVMALYGRSSSSECGIDEHDAILETLRQRDAAAAAFAMVHHLEHILERVSFDGELAEEPGLGEILSRYAARPRRND
ncbi:GntR family transcriptional regulator [Ensifer sp. NPDC090286]|uniref:GntR family transcriptional regulator n=1 Tax=Ensifer sp. NPDC090286 TaxID=3363991 RepID=UPI00383B581B